MKSLAIEYPDKYKFLEETNSPTALNWSKAASSNCNRSLSEPEGSRYTKYLQTFINQTEIPKEIQLPIYIDNWVYSIETKNSNRNYQVLKRRFKGKDPTHYKKIISSKEISERLGREVKIQRFLPDPTATRALVFVSENGASENAVVEIDLVNGGFLAGGFELPFAYNSCTYLDKDTMVAATTAFGDISKANYPSKAFLFKRGEKNTNRIPILSAGEKTLSISVESGFDGDVNYLVLVEWEGFNEKVIHLYDKDKKITRRLNTPYRLVYVNAQTSLFFFKGNAILINQEPVSIRGKEVPSGSVLAIDLEDPNAELKLVWMAKKGEVIKDIRPTKDFLILHYLKDGESKLVALNFKKGEINFTNARTKKIIIPPNGSIAPLPALGASNANRNEVEISFAFQSFTQSPVIYKVENGKLDLVDRMPNLFKGSDFEVHKYFATSLDGTKIPYFIIGPKGFEARRDNPTVITAYGAFGDSKLPTYLNDWGPTWLNDGGVYVLANVRGGSELGPEWHTSVTGVNVLNRFKTSEDINAVAEDLLKRRITTSEKLGVQGRSAGGVTVSSAVLKNSKLYRAVALVSPVIDLVQTENLRVSNLAREFGNPDVEAERENLLKNLAYYSLPKADGERTSYLIYTSTTDDIAYPGHARKMAARLMELGYETNFYESPTGGHQAIGVGHERDAMILEFFYEKLIK